MQAVTGSSKWEDVKPLVEDAVEYRCSVVYAQGVVECVAECGSGS